MRLIAVCSIVTLLLAGCASVADEPATSEPQVVSPIASPFSINEEVDDLHAQILAAVANGTTVTLPMQRVNDLVTLPMSSEEMEFDLVLHADDRFVTPETWVETPGNLTTGLEALSLYEGHVAGAEDQLVRVAVGPDWARAIVRVGDIQYIARIGLENNIPITSPILSDGRVQWAPEFPASFDGPDFADHDCLSLAPTDLTPVVETGRSQMDTIVADIILDADTLYWEQMGEHAVPFLVAMFWENDAIYDHEVGIQFRLAGVHVHENYTFEVEPGADFEGLSAYWNQRDLDRDIVHMVTGSESSYAQANCIGGAGIPSESYTFTPLNWEYEYEIFHLTALAHELGHIFNAHHHYGNHAEANGELATLMIQGYTPGVNPVFSTVSKTTIRGWTEAYVA